MLERIASSRRLPFIGWIALGIPSGAASVPGAASTIGRAVAARGGLVADDDELLAVDLGPDPAGGSCPCSTPLEPLDQTVR
jgi:hypothetical protein